MIMTWQVLLFKGIQWKIIFYHFKWYIIELILISKLNEYNMLKIGDIRNKIPFENECHF